MEKPHSLRSAAHTTCHTAPGSGPDGHLLNPSTAVGHTADKHSTSIHQTGWDGGFFAPPALDTLLHHMSVHGIA